ncbi:glycosyltransferase, partial [Candidatus Latescibacterota bacterium]
HCNEVGSWLIGLLVKAARPDKRVVFDVHEHYPSRFDEPHVPRWIRVWGRPLLRLLFRVLPRWTDHLVFAKRSVASDFPLVSGKYSYIYNYAPVRMLPSSSRQFHTGGEVAAPGGSVAVHLGPFSRARGWPQLLEALRLMETEDLEVLCLGDVYPSESALLAEAERLGVRDRVHLSKRVDYSEMLSYLLGADMGVMLYQPGIQNHVYAFPMKMYDYMLAGIPFIGPEFAIEVRPVVCAERCGLLVDTGSSEQVAKAMDWLCANRDEARAMGERGRKAVMKRYNWDTQSEKLVRLYERLAGDESRSR